MEGRKEAVHTQRGARLSAEEVIKGNFSSGFSNIYYVFPFSCSNGTAFAPASPLPGPLPASASFLLSFILALALRFRGKNLNRFGPADDGAKGRRRKILFLFILYWQNTLFHLKRIFLPNMIWFSLSQC